MVEEGLGGACGHFGGWFAKDVEKRRVASGGGRYLLYLHYVK